MAIKKDNLIEESLKIGMGSGYFSRIKCHDEDLFNELYQLGDGSLSEGYWVLKEERTKNITQAIEMVALLEKTGEFDKLAYALVQVGHYKTMLSARKSLETFMNSGTDRLTIKSKGNILAEKIINIYPTVSEVRIKRKERVAVIKKIHGDNSMELAKAFLAKNKKEKK